MGNDSETPKEEQKIKVDDRRFWARREAGARKPGERPERRSDYPSVVEQLQAQMEAGREKLKDRYRELEQEQAAFKKRMELEMERRAESKRLELVKVLLDVLDNLDSALSASSATDAPNAAPATLGEGVRVIRDDLWSRLRKLDVARIEAAGSPFDPELHEAVMTRAAPPEQDGLVIEETQAGYRIGETVLRPAKVVVGAGP